MKLAQERENKYKKLDTSTYCEPCGKKFKSESSYNAHLPSKKHKKNEKALALKAPKKPVEAKKEEMVQEETGDEEFETTYDNPVVCLFTGDYNDTVEKNIKSMNKGHGFFVLEKDCCSDINGLLKYLGDLVYQQFTCIMCEKHFKDARSVQNHMVDKQHCFMVQDDFEQYEEFYDFREFNERKAKELHEKYKHLKQDDSNTLMYAIEGDKTGVVQK